MPAFVKTQKDEAAWQRAKRQVRAQYKDIDEQSDKFWALTNSIYQKMRQGGTMKKSATSEKPKYYKINPHYKDRDRVSGFSPGNALKWGLGTGILSGIISSIAAHKLPEQDRAKLGLGVGGLGFGLGYAGRALYDSLRGTTYDTDKYDIAGVKPTDTVVIGMSGATGGPGGPVDKTLNKLYGAGNVAMFNWRSRDKLVKFLKNLPKETRVIAHGHSYGGSSITNAVAESGKPIDTLITYDPVSWTERHDKRPANVRRWLNVLPIDTRADIANNWIAHIGGRWDKQRGADRNLYIGKGLGHASVAELFNAGFNA